MTIGVWPRDSLRIFLRRPVVDVEPSSVRRRLDAVRSVSFAAWDDREPALRVPFPDLAGVGRIGAGLWLDAAVGIGGGKAAARQRCDRVERGGFGRDDAADPGERRGRRPRVDLEHLDRLAEPVVDEIHRVHAIGTWPDGQPVGAQLLFFTRVDRTGTLRVGALVEPLDRLRHRKHLRCGEGLRVHQRHAAADVPGHDHPLGSRNRHEVLRAGDAADELDLPVGHAARRLLRRDGRCRQGHKRCQSQNSNMHR